MKIIVGLGNPGEKYKKNRHNVGFLFIDFIINQCQMLDVKSQIHMSKVKSGKKIIIEKVNIEFDNHELLLVKPQLFMNQSGIAVKKSVISYQLSVTNDLYIVHDDLDIKLGDYKIQFGKGPKLHNGIESIEKTLKTKDFWRIRIGVDNRNPEKRISGEKYVLQNFNRQEIEILQRTFKLILDELTNSNFIAIPSEVE